MDGQETHKAKSFFAVFIQNYGETLEVDYACARTQTGEKAIEDVDVGFGVNLLVCNLVERNDGISYYRNSGRVF